MTLLLSACVNNVSIPINIISWLYTSPAVSSTNASSSHLHAVTHSSRARADGLSLLCRGLSPPIQYQICPGTLTPKYFSIDGITIFRNELSTLNKNFRKDIKHSKVVYNMLNRSFRRHLSLYSEFTRISESDWQFLQQYFGSKGLSVSAGIRMVLKDYLQQLRQN
jgi:hypothetical protein